MKTLWTLSASALALTLCSPAIAQDSSATPAEAGETESAPIDPARLATAQSTVDYLFPLGTYERMMKGTMDQMMDAMMMNLGNMRIGDLASAGGVARGDIPNGEGEKTLNEVAEEMDPDYKERMQISTKIIMDEMVGLMTQMEPQIRETLTKIYARKFTVSQLSEMNSFFATDTGSAFARDYMMVFVDPEMMQAMMSMVPEMMQAMPDIMKKVETATAHLPPVKTTAQRLEETLNGEAEEAGDDDFGGDDDTAWEDSENWSAEDRDRVNKLSTESDTAFEKYYEALEQAQSNARERMQKKK